LDGFVSCLAPSPSDLNPNPHASVIITEKAWHNRANWSGDEWNTWETWGWYRQFCRAVCLSGYTVSFHEADLLKYLIVLAVPAQLRHHPRYCIVRQNRVLFRSCCPTAKANMEYRCWSRTVARVSLDLLFIHYKHDVTSYLFVVSSDCISALCNV
jgi:hypothetical protein